MLLAAGVYANHHQYAQPFVHAPQHGLVVYGFGERKTPEAFRNACNRFIYVENLIGDGCCRRYSGEEGVPENSAR